MEDAWTRVEGAVRLSTRLVGTVGLLALFLNACIVVVDIVLRRAFSAPIDRFSDVSAVIFFMAAACCIPIVMAEQRNITIRVFGGIARVRVRALIEIFAGTTVAAVLGIIVYQVYLYTGELAATGRTLTQIPVPIAPFWGVVTILLGLAWVVQLFVIATLIRQAVRAGTTGPVSGTASKDPSIL